MDRGKEDVDCHHNGITMNHDHNNMDDSLLLLYLTGKANEEDQEKIVEWLEKDAGNRKHLDQLENIG